MFIERCSGWKCGKDHACRALVESVGTARGPRHRVVAYLGEVSPAEQRGWARLAAALDGKAEARVRQLSLIERVPDDDPVRHAVRVKLGEVRVEGTRDFGDVHLGLSLRRMLGLDDILAPEIPRGREEVP